MIHRECAMMGVPVITQAYSGLADAHNWAIVVEGGKIVPIPAERNNAAGEYRIVDVGELAAKIRQYYDKPWAAQQLGIRGARWLYANQTWDHAAATLLGLLERETRPIAAETGVMDYA
jgi:hypothetical protein